MMLPTMACLGRGHMWSKDSTEHVAFDSLKLTIIEGRLIPWFNDCRCPQYVIVKRQNAYFLSAM